MGIAKGLLSGLLGVGDFSGEVLARQAGKGVRRAIAPAAVGGGTALAVKKHGEPHQEHQHVETTKQAALMGTAKAVGQHLDRHADRYLALAGTGASLVAAHASLRSARAREHQAYGQEKKAFWAGFEKEAALFSIKHEIHGAKPEDVAKVINRLSNLKPRHFAAAGAATGAGYSAGKNLADRALKPKNS